MAPSESDFGWAELRDWALRELDWRVPSPSAPPGPKSWSYRGGTSITGDVLGVAATGSGSHRRYDRSHKRRLRAYHQTREILGLDGSVLIFDILEKAAEHEGGFVCVWDRQVWWSPDILSPFPFLHEGLLIIPLID